jgi:hypothetical protein
MLRCTVMTRLTLKLTKLSIRLARNVEVFEVSLEPLAHFIRRDGIIAKPVYMVAKITLSIFGYMALHGSNS